MKGIVLIMSLFLSSVFCGIGAGYDIPEERLQETVVASIGKNTVEKSDDFNDAAILPVGTALYSGDGNSSAPTFRSTNSGRRVQPSSKSSFRVIKAGKVFDRNHFKTFRSVLFQFHSGIHSIRRYIHSLCNLLI